MLPLIDQLERRGVFDAMQAGQLRRYAHTENLKRKALDQHALEECWQKIPAAQKRDAKVAAAAAQCYLALGGVAQALQIIEQALATEWDSELVGLYAECDGRRRDTPDRACRAVAEIQPARRRAAAHAGQVVRAAGAVGQSAELPRSEHLGGTHVLGASCGSRSCTTGSATPTPRAGTIAKASNSPSIS